MVARNALRFMPRSLNCIGVPSKGDSRIGDPFPKRFRKSSYFEVVHQLLDDCPGCEIALRSNLGPMCRTCKPRDLSAVPALEQA